MGGRTVIAFLTDSAENRRSCESRSFMPPQDRFPPMKSITRRHFARLLAVMCAVLAECSSGVADEAVVVDATGSPTAALVPTFYSRVVTGPLMNKSVCYVCRNGNRPVVMVLIRKTDGALQTLLRGIDTVVDRHRAEGLRSFGVILSDEPGRSAPAVQTFAFDGEIAMPLCVTAEALAGPGGLSLERDADVTVVLYRQRRVKRQFTFRSGELDGEAIAQVVDQVRRFATQMPASAGAP